MKTVYLLRTRVLAACLIFVACALKTSQREKKKATPPTERADATILIDTMLENHNGFSKLCAYGETQNMDWNECLWKQVADTIEEKWAHLKKSIRLNTLKDAKTPTYFQVP